MTTLIGRDKVPYVRLFAAQNIQAGDILTLDYRTQMCNSGVNFVRKHKKIRNVVSDTSMASLRVIYIYIIWALQRCDCVRCTDTQAKAEGAVREGPSAEPKNNEGQSLNASPVKKTMLECAVEAVQMESKKLDCVDCKRTFPNAKRLKRHKRMHSTKMYVCENCGLETRYEYSFKRHQRRNVCKR